MLDALGGLALFLFGLAQLSTHLRELAGPSLNRLMRLARRAPIIGVFAGITVTAVAQSGTAVELMTTAFVDTGLLGVREGLAAVLGSAIGGTLTVQIVSFHVSAIALPLAGIGFIIGRFRPAALKHAGGAVVGLALVFLGLQALVGALGPIATSPLARDLLSAMSATPLLVAALGAAFATLAHSSNAPTILAVALAASRVLSLDAAAALVVGANLGTPLNVYMDARARGVNARRVAASHLTLKLTGAAIALALLGPAVNLLQHLGGPERLVANAHTSFNLVVAIVALPLLGIVEKLARRFLPDPEPGGVRPRYLARDALDRPTLAFSLAFREVTRVADHVLEMVKAVPDALRRDRGAIERMRREEEVVDSLVHEVIVYAARVGEDVPATAVQALVTVGSSLESIGDLVKRLLRQDEKLLARGLSLTPEGRTEVLEVAEAVFDRLRLVLTALSIGDARGCERAAADAARVEAALNRSRAAHLARLRSGRDESELTSSVHLDTLTILEQVNAEASAIASIAPRLVLQLS